MTVKIIGHKKERVLQQRLLWLPARTSLADDMKSGCGENRRMM